MKILAMLALRRAILPLLAGTPAVTDQIPAARLYPEDAPVAPAWPFARVGEITAAPFAPSGVDGAVLSGTVHVFAKGPGADDVIRAAAAIGDVLDVAILDLSADMGQPAKAHVSVTGAPLLRDQAEQGAWQVAVQFSATVEIEA